MLLLAEYNLGTLLSRQHLRHSGDLTDIFVFFQASGAQQRFY